VRCNAQARCGPPALCACWRAHNNGVHVRRFPPASRRPLLTSVRISCTCVFSPFVVPWRGLPAAPPSLLAAVLHARVTAPSRRPTAASMTSSRLGQSAVRTRSPFDRRPRTAAPTRSSRPPPWYGPASDAPATRLGACGPCGMRCCRRCGAVRRWMARGRPMADGSTERWTDAATMEAGDGRWRGQTGGHARRIGRWQPLRTWLRATPAAVPARWRCAGRRDGRGWWRWRGRCWTVCCAMHGWGRRHATRVAPAWKAGCRGRSSSGAAQGHACSCSPWRRNVCFAGRRWPAR